MPIAQDFALNPDVLVELSGADRIGTLSSTSVMEVDALSHADEDEFSTAMEMIGAALRTSIERRTSLWLGIVDVEHLDTVRCVFGDSAQVAGEPSDVPDHWKLRLPSAITVVPLAVSPTRFLKRCLAENSGLKDFAHRHLEGLDTKRTTHERVLMLRESHVPVYDRTLAFRLAHSPVVWAYITVLVYSIFRALPVVFVPHFHGNIWVLWALDVVGAIPYTWGVIAMFTARKVLVRIVALLVAVITFMAPYVYFWSHGHGYPLLVNLVVGAFIASAILLETYRGIRDRRVRRLVEARP